MDFPSPAKVNLSLKVGDVDATGYHPIDTVVHLLDFEDTISIEPSDRLTVTSDKDLGILPDDNLAFRAARKMGEAFAKRADYHIHLQKRIPMGAGLGGGSSNAATVIKALAHLWSIEPSNPRLIEVAQGIGSDVALFLAPTTCSQMSGYGDVFVASLPMRTGQTVVLVMAPDSYGATQEVYETFDEIGSGIPTLPLVNDLRDAAIAVSPQTGEVLEWLTSYVDAQQAQVCGSGAACFALTDSEKDSHTIAEAAEALGLWAVATTLR
jgi:4-diphosphocytidyl-2-C-methyl-D-erythritol kinase